MAFGRFATGLAVGVAGAVAARYAAPALGGAVRPIGRSLLKAGMIGYEKTREAFAELSESFEDMAAETRHELEQDRHAPELETGTAQASHEGEQQVPEERAETG